VFANGTAARARNGGVSPELYAPAAWQPGSSVSHLDDDAYPNGTANSLMTHALGIAEAVHDPGPIVRGMLSDIGWSVESGPSSISAPRGVRVTH
jgi:hypothetical protein